MQTKKCHNTHMYVQVRVYLQNAMTWRLFERQITSDVRRSKVGATVTAGDNEKNGALCINTLETKSPLFFI